MLKLLAVSVLVIGLSVQACGQGCLKCSANNDCVFCDSLNNYYLLGTSCVPATQLNCAELSQNGDCTVCSTNFHIDSSTKKCVAVETAKLVANCISYSNTQACLKCAKSFFVKDGKCVAVAKLIDNCEFYSADGVCASCAVGYIFSAFRDGCLPLPNSANCGAFSFIECKACRSGYISNQNLYFTDFTISATTILAQILASATVSRDWANPRRCQAIADPSCLVATSASVCATCKSGFFLTDAKTCKANPSPIIESCMTYQSLTACRLCLPGFYLESGAKCTAIAANQLINDCNLYDSGARTVVCTQCMPGKYLEANACLNARVVSLTISQCKATTVDADTCEECIQGFSLTNDKKKCLASVANCLTYDTSNPSPMFLTCRVCKDTFFLSTANGVASCVAGGLEGCLSYSSADICNACNPNGYYKSGPGCSKHVAIENCATYSATIANQCATCAVGFYPFGLSVTCASITPIAKCARYSDTATCAECVAGYFRLGNSCVALSTLPNCKSAAADGTCAACNDGFVLTGSPLACVALHSYITDNCASVVGGAAFKDWTTVDASCAVCKESAEPFSVGNHFVCLDNSRLATKGITGGTLVDMCKRYGNVLGAPKCFQCSAPKKLKLVADVYSCVDSCGATTETHLADTLDGRADLCVLYANTVNFGLSECAEAIVVNDGTSFVATCTGFNSGKVNIVDAFAPDDKPQYSQDVSGSTVPQPSGAFLYYGFVLVSGNAADIEGGGAAITNCELYAVTGAKAYCYRCKWGFASTATDIAGPPVTKSSSCGQVTNCDTATVYGGFSARLNQLLTCHKCSGGQALLLTVEGAESSALTITNLRTAVPSLQCVPANSPTLPSSAATPNCLVHVNIGLTATAVAGLTKGCAACGPGFKPNTADPIFASCSAVDTCNTAKNNVMANRCGACSQLVNGSTVNRAFKSLALQDCVTVSTANCLIASSVAVGGAFPCDLCQAGFVKNTDGQCTKFTFPKCNDSSVSSVPVAASATSISYYNIIKKLTGQLNLKGCDNCSVGNTAVYLPAEERQCVGSDYVAQNAYASGTIFVPDCARYANKKDTSGTTQYTCALCKGTKAVTENGKLCVAVQNCGVAQSSPNEFRCKTCLDAFVNVSGTCVLKTLANCATWADSSSGTDQKCAACADGFFLTPEKTCQAGSVAFCKTFLSSSPFTCLACLAGYSKISTADLKTYCIKINANSNCAALDEAGGLQGGLYKCAACSVSDGAAYFIKQYSNLPSQATLPQSVCLALNQVDKCVAYGTSNPNVGSNSLLCTACTDGFYLNTTANACAARTNQSSNCVKYNPAADKCETCSDTTYKNAAETDCVTFPRGILGCATYSNDTVCTSCNAPRYLLNSACQLSTLVSKCAAYSANFTCTACDSGYFLTNSTFCEVAKASNCYTYISATVCEKCDPANTNKGLRTGSDGVVNCVDKNVPNCEISTNNFPFVCLQCKRGFYQAADASCVGTVTIDKCAIYDSASTCTLCDSGAVLTLDRRSCNDTFFASSNDIFCAESKLLPAAACSRCSPGYLFQNGTCSSCANSTFASGCFSCDPTNQTVCFACRPGYYQSANGTCRPNAIVAPNNTNGTDSAVLAKVLTLWVLLSLILAGR